MRHTELITGIRQINEALVASKLKALFESMLDGDEQEPTSSASTAQVLTALKEYALHAQHFNGAAQQLTLFLELDELETPDVWTKLIGDVDADYVRQQHQRIDVVTGYLPPIAELLRQDTEQTLQETGLPYEEDGRLTIVVIEQDQHLSSPQRLAELFLGIEKLYEVCAVVAGVQADKISVLACESGRDKAFDFVGSPSVIQELKKLIMSVWDRVVFFREHDLTERIERVADSLYVLERIQEMQAADKLGPEQAEILSRGVRNGVKRFLESGAIIPEIEERAQYDPRELMSPEPKLLVGSSASMPADDMHASGPLDSLGQSSPPPKDDDTLTATPAPNLGTEAGEAQATAVPAEASAPPEEAPPETPNDDSEEEHAFTVSTHYTAEDPPAGEAPPDEPAGEESDPTNPGEGEEGDEETSSSGMRGLGEMFDDLERMFQRRGSREEEADEEHESP